MKKILALALALLMLVGASISFTSCGEKLQFGKKYTPLSAQMDVLAQLNSKSIDVGVMDSIMAGYYLNQDDSDYKGKLMIVEDVEFEAEQYGIAARKGSGLAKAINHALISLSKAGVVEEIAEKYGIASEVCIDEEMEMTDYTEEEMEDVNYIIEQGKFIVGYTIFAPIAYKDDNGDLIGFDIELAEAVAEVMGIEVEFKEIDWDSKEALLNNKTIDCIWNGMTITEERLANMEISMPYLNNKQVAIIRVEDKDVYTNLDSMSKAIIGAEAGSAGEACVKIAEEE
ncbi:MAG: transporter substrate-binding domain-containing protein [Clostridia bacterium]|nr:transporter substrate-binding domain-containing protein [Clostridia bacterium]